MRWLTNISHAVTVGTAWVREECARPPPPARACASLREPDAYESFDLLVFVTGEASQALVCIGMLMYRNRTCKRPPGNFYGFIFGGNTGIFFDSAASGYAMGTVAGIHGRSGP